MSKDTEIDSQILTRVEEINNFLDSFEQQHGFAPLKNAEKPKCLFASIEDLRKKTPDELLEYTYQINEYSFYIQRIINKNKALQRWAKVKLDEMTAHYLPDVGNNYGFNERVIIARNSPDICKKLNVFLCKIEMELDRLYSCPDNIRVMSDTIKEFKFAALKREKNG